LAQVCADGFDDQLMIVALSQARYGEAADDPGTFDVNGKRTAVSGKVRDGVAALFEGLTFELEVESHAIRAAMVARDDVGFAANPLGVVGGSAFEGGVEERLIEAAHVNDDRQTAFDGHGAEAVAELPGCLGVKARKAEFALLLRYTTEVFGKAHGVFSLQGGAGSSQVSARSSQRELLIYAEQVFAVVLLARSGAQDDRFDF